MADEIPAGQIPPRSGLVKALGLDSAGSLGTVSIETEVIAPTAANATAAAASASAAAQWAIAASAVIGDTLYEDTTAGLAATSDGDAFKVVSSDTDALCDIYRKHSGSAVYIDSQPNVGAVIAAKSKARTALVSANRTLGQGPLLGSALAPLAAAGRVDYDLLPALIADSDGVLCAEVRVAADDTVIFRRRADGTYRDFTTAES